MYYLTLLNQAMILQSIGAEVAYLGWFRLQGQVFIVMVHHRAKRVRARKRLHMKAPNNRLHIDGVSYVN